MALNNCIFTLLPLAWQTFGGQASASFHSFLLLERSHNDFFAISGTSQAYLFLGCLLIDFIFFWRNFRFIVKSSRRYKDFPYKSAPTHVKLPPLSTSSTRVGNIFYNRQTYSNTSLLPKLNSSLGFILSVVHSLSMDKHIMTCICHCSISYRVVSLPKTWCSA